MPLTASFDQRRNWVLVRGTGVVGLGDVLDVIRTARTTTERQMSPMLVDVRAATTTMTEEDVERAVDAVRQVVQRGEVRGHVAIAAADDTLYARLLLYETRCAEIGASVIRIFRQLSDAERWLEIVSATRHFR